MSSSFDNLLDLAADATRTSNLLDLGIRMSKKDFFELNGLINKLQTTCPNHPAVVAARVHWYRIAHTNFELYFVVALEKNEIPPDSKVWQNEDALLIGQGIPNLFCGTEILNDYMRRSYLKQDFKDLYNTLIALYKRAYMCDNTPAKIGDMIWRMQNRLQDNLLDGKL